MPNVPAMVGFFALALVSYLSAISLERALARAQGATRALQESEARYHTLFDGVPVGLFRSTPSGDIIDANPTLAQVLGCKREPCATPRCSCAGRTEPPSGR